MFRLPGGTAMQIVADPAGNLTILPQDGVPPAPQVSGGLRWYVPYTRVHERTLAPPEAVWVNVAPSPVSYYGLLFGLWQQAESFALLEHDVVWREDVTSEFESCPEPWCVFGYDDICHPECQEAWANMLGCTRFRFELIRAVPDAVSAIPQDSWDWHSVCDGLGKNLRAAGFTHHWHFPAVEHHHMGRHDV